MSRIGTTGVCLVGLALSSACVQAYGSDFTPPEVAPLTRLKKLYPRTVLVENGRPRAFIVIPEGQTYAALAGRLRDRIRRAARAALEVRRAAELVDKDWRVDHRRIGKKNLIALGNVNTNRLLAVLSGGRYVAADSIYPGKGGYVVRTVHDPWATGANVLVLAGSHLPGVEKAIAVFEERFLNGSGRTLLIPKPIVRVELNVESHPFIPDGWPKYQPQYRTIDWFKERLGGFVNRAGQVVAHPDGRTDRVGVTWGLAALGETYFMTGDEKLLPLMQDLVRKNRGLLKNPAKLHEMGARSAGHVKQWDLLEELPIWTDRDRLDVTNALLMDAAIGHERRSFHWKVREGFVQVIGENHDTFSAGHSFDAWYYFHKYYDVPASEYWMHCAEAVFSAQASTFQILEDASGYLCYAPGTAIRYAFKSRDLRYLSRGVAREHARYVALACLNNLGLGTGFGDSGNILSVPVFGLLAPVAWYHRDPYLYWIIRTKLRQNYGLRKFQSQTPVDLEVEPREPSDWTGVIRIPLYENPLGEVEGRAVREPVFAPKKDVDPKLFNKIVFKENWDEDGQYLLLDGAGVWRGPGPHGHKHNDINTIVNFTDEGRMWLVDHTYEQRGFQEHTGAFLAREGAFGYGKYTLARLDNMAQNETWGLTRTTLDNWERSIFWKKGRYFLVIDRVTAGEDGDHFARCTFKALGRAELRGAGLYLGQQGRFCKIVSDGGAETEIEDKPFRQRRNWEQPYPHAEPVARMFRQDKVRSLRKGKSITFLNLIHAYASRDDEDRITMKPVSDTCALVVEDGAPTILGTGEIPGGVGRADMFAVSRSAVFTTSAGLHRPEERPAGEALRLGETQRARALATARAQVERRAERPSSPASGEPEVRGLRTRTVELGQPVSTLLAADVDGDGGEEWIAGGPRGVGLYASDGRRRWTYATAADVRALDAADLDGDGRPEVVFGCDDEKVRALDASGREIWSFVCKGSDPSYGRPAVDYVKIADLEGDGRNEVIAGAHWVHVLTRDGKLEWEQFMDFRRGRVVGDFAAGDVADLDGDGRLDVVAAFLTSYCLMRAMDADGRVVMPVDYKGLFLDKTPREGHKGVNVAVPVALATVDLDGDGRTRQVVCATKRNLHFFWHDHKRREKGGGSLSGPFTGLCVARSGQRPRPAVIVASNNLYGVVAVEARPGKDGRRFDIKKLWYRTLDAQVTALAAADLDADGEDEIYAGTRAGDVYALTAAKGEEVGLAGMPGPPVAALAYATGARAVLAAKRDGTVVVIRR